MIKVRKTAVSIVLAIIMVINLIPVMIAKADDLNAVMYIDADGIVKRTDNYKLLEDEDIDDENHVLTDGWYFCYDIKELTHRLTIEGTVNLILFEDVHLTAWEGISVPEDATLNIYSGTLLGFYETNGGVKGTGELIAYTSDRNNACIGGTMDENENPTNCGTITINSGIVTAKSTNQLPAIGAGNHGSIRSITINGGVVSVESNGVCIGSESYDESDNGSITINGGVVRARSDLIDPIIGTNGSVNGTGEPNGIKININGGIVDIKTSPQHAIGHSYLDRVTIAPGVMVYGSEDQNSLDNFPSDRYIIDTQNHTTEGYFTGGNKCMKTIKYSTVTLNFGDGHRELADQIKASLESFDESRIVDIPDIKINDDNTMTIKIADGYHSFIKEHDQERYINDDNPEHDTYTPLTTARMQGFILYNVIRSLAGNTKLDSITDETMINNGELFSGVARNSLSTYQTMGKSTLKDIRDAEKTEDYKPVSDQTFYLLWAKNKISSAPLTVNKPTIGSPIGGYTNPSINLGSTYYTIDSNSNEKNMSWWFDNDLNNYLDYTTASKGSSYGAKIALMPKLGYYFSSKGTAVSVSNGTYKESKVSYQYENNDNPFNYDINYYNEIYGKRKYIPYGGLMISIKDITAKAGSTGSTSYNYSPSYDTPATMPPQIPTATPTATPTVSPTATPTITPTANPTGKYPTTINTEKIKTTYNGSMINISLANINISGSRKNPKITYYDSNKNRIDKVISAGNYYYKVSVEESDIYEAAESDFGDLIVKKAVPKIGKTPPESLSFKFFRSEKTKSKETTIKMKKKIISFSVSIISGNKNITLTQKENSNNKFIITVNKRIRSGLYKIKYRITTDEAKNYKKAKFEKQLTVKVSYE